LKTVEHPAAVEPDDYHRNFAGGLIHGVFFQLSEAFSNINTVLPSFIATLTASTVAMAEAVVAALGVRDPRTDPDGACIT
jgi:hypothetical protein